MSSHGSRVRLSALLAAVIGGVSALAAPAGGAVPVSLGACNTSTLTRPFVPWADVASYELAPDGDFERGAWTLTGGATRARGSEPYAATGALGSSSLALPRGSSGQSPPTCVSAAYPTVRFFIGGTGSVLVTIVDGNLEVPAGVAVAGFRWLPTPVMTTSSAVMAATSGGVAQVSVRLTALTGAPTVDDVFIDPWNRG
jgi:hypothetical protein